MFGGRLLKFRAVRIRLDHVVIHVEDGPGTSYGGRDEGTSVYFRDPDGSLLEFISYER